MLVLWSCILGVIVLYIVTRDSSLSTNIRSPFLDAPDVLFYSLVLSYYYYVQIYFSFLCVGIIAKMDFTDVYRSGALVRISFISQLSYSSSAGTFLPCNMDQLLHSLRKPDRLRLGTKCSRMRSRLDRKYL
jgi:hypothetical protein